MDGIPRTFGRKLQDQMADLGFTEKTYCDHGS